MDDDKKWSRKGAESEEDDDGQQEEVFEAETVTLHEAEAITVHQADAIIPPTQSNKKKPNPWKISVDESVNYGFTVIKGVFPYLMGILLMYVVAAIAFFLSLDSDDTLSIILLGGALTSFVIGILFQISLMIGLGYKFGGDVLLRAVRTHHLVRKK